MFRAGFFRKHLARLCRGSLPDVRSRAHQRLPHQSGWIEELVADDDEEPDRILQRAGEIDSVFAAVSLLTARQRRFVELHFEDGLSYKQIALEAAVSPRTVLRELTRAYAKLRQMLEAERTSRPHGP